MISRGVESARATLGRVRDQRGFTLIEMMIVVAVIAILAAIAIPFFFGESRKQKAASETSAMFAELGVKEEQYKIENHVYFPNPGTATAAVAQCPTTPTPTAQAIASCLTTSWASLNVTPPATTVLCGYALTAGASGTVPSPPAPFTMATPVAGWYYIVATCELDGNTAVHSTYFTSSVDTTIQKANPGS